MHTSIYIYIYTYICIYMYIIYIYIYRSISLKIHVLCAVLVCALCVCYLHGIYLFRIIQEQRKRVWHACILCRCKVEQKPSLTWTLQTRVQNR
jgi:hypothetical protein